MVEAQFRHTNLHNRGVIERFINQITPMRIASCNVSNDPYRLVKI